MGDLNTMQKPIVINKIDNENIKKEREDSYKEAGNLLPQKFKSIKDHKLPKNDVKP